MIASARCQTRFIKRAAIVSGALFLFLLFLIGCDEEQRNVENLLEQNPAAIALRKQAQESLERSSLAIDQQGELLNRAISDAVSKKSMIESADLQMIKTELLKIRFDLEKTNDEFTKAISLSNDLCNQNLTPLLIKRNNAEIQRLDPLLNAVNSLLDDPAFSNPNTKSIFTSYIDESITKTDELQKVSKELEEFSWNQIYGGGTCN